MSEGELKKRMRKILEEETGTTDAGYISTLLKPIDDVKKDFPFLDPSKYNSLCEFAEKREARTAEWFKKCFGDSK